MPLLWHNWVTLDKTMVTFKSALAKYGNPNGYKSPLVIGMMRAEWKSRGLHLKATVNQAREFFDGDRSAMHAVRDRVSRRMHVEVAEKERVLDAVITWYEEIIEAINHT